MEDPDLLVGYNTDDDAAAYRLPGEGGELLLQTVDFFPPMVDDPYIFGQITAANALSDIYAMGGKPKLALNLFAFPSDKLPRESAEAILRGGAEKILEAGAVLCGGHTIEDKEPKYGLCVTGFVKQESLLRNNTAQSGDALILTKPLGSGILNTAAKAGLLEKEQHEALISAMTALNAAAAEAMEGLCVHACTDVTGFALIGHSVEMAKGSGVTIELQTDRLPLLPGTVSFARMGVIPAGAYRNRSYFEGDVLVLGEPPLELQDICYDPQTSGGLLISVSEKDAVTLLARLHEHSDWARQIGRVIPASSAAVKLH